MVGKNDTILHKTEMTVNVNPLSDEFGMMSEVPLVHAVVAYNCPLTGQTYILIINNALYIAEMEQHLLPPIMMKLNRILLDEFLKFLCPNLTVETDSIFFSDKSIRLPLELHVTTSYPPTRRPNGIQEVNEHMNIALTTEHPEWNPNSTIFSQQENAMTNWKGEKKEET